MQPVEEEVQDASTQYELGRKYLEGIGLEQDHKEAARWLKKAALQGHVKVIINNLIDLKLQ